MAKNDIKRVGLEFTADGVQDFKRSLSEVNNQLAISKNEFKRTTLAYDENTKAADKLADKQKYLSEQVTLHKDRIKALTRELEDYSASEGANENQIKKKTLAIERAKTELTKYEVDLKSVSKEVEKGTANFEELAKKVDDVGQKMKSTGESMTRNVTVPIMAVATGAVVAFKTIDEAYDNIIVKTGATGAELDGLTKVFDSIYGNFPFETQAVSDAVGEVSTRFGYANEELEDASLAFLQFAEINKVDVNTAIASVSRSLEASGEPLTKYNDLLDIATVASQKTGLSVDELFSSYEKYGAQLRSVGFDMDDSVALLAQIEKSGMNVDNVFAALKTANKNWASSGKDANKEFSKTIESIKNAKTETDALKIATETFGSKAAVEFTESIRTGRFEIESMTDALSGYSGSTATTFESTLDPIDNSTVAMNNLTLAGAELGKEIQSALGPIFESLSQILKDVATWFKGLDDSTKRTILIILAIVAAIGPVLVILGMLASSISSLIGLWGIISGVMAGTAGAAFVGMLPVIGGVVLAIVAVIAIIKLVVDNWEWLSTKFSEIGTNISNFFSTMFTSIGTMFTNFLNAGISLFSKLWEGIKNVFFSFLRGGIPGLINDYILKPFLGIDLFQVGIDIINGLWGGISSMVGSLFDGIKGIAGGLIDSAKQALDINSPSKEFEKIGTFTGEGFAIGLQNSIGKLNNQVYAMADSSIAAFTQGEVVHNHTGVIRVEGIDNQGQMNSVVEILMDRLRREVRK